MRRRSFRFARTTIVALGACLLIPNTFGAVKTWDGGAAVGYWTAGTNWDLDVAPVANDFLTFAGTNSVYTTNDFAAGTTFGGLSFSSGAGSFSLSGSGITLAGSVNDAAVLPQQISLQLALLSPGQTFTVAAGGQLEVSQTVSGSPAFIKDGLGTLMLSAANTYTGGTVVSNGVLRLLPGNAPVPGMIYWLDASELATVLKGGDGRVSQWNDRSGNSRHFSQTNTAAQPLFVPDGMNGRPVLRFDGSADQLVFSSSTSPRTVFIVNRVATGANLKGLWGLAGGDTGVRMSGTNAWQHPGNVNDFTNPTNSVLYVNGGASNRFSPGTVHVVTAARATSTTFGKTAMGGYFSGRYYSGDVGEVLVYDRVLTEAERQQVESYLVSKWLGPARPGLVSTPPVTGSVLWLDAANTATLTTDGSNRVSRWNDAGAGSGPSYASQANATLQPTFVPYALNGLPAVDFGAYSSDAAGANTNYQWLGFDTQLTTVRTVFWVGRGPNFILGDDNRYHFHRGGETDNSPLWHSSYTSPSILNGKTYLNGGVVNGTTTGLPDGFAILSVVTTNNCEASRIASDRVYRAGGQQIAEVLIYDRALTDQERRDTEAYLQNKWFVSSVSTDRLPPNTAVTLAAPGAVLDLNGVDESIGSLSGVAGSSLMLGVASLTTGGNNSSSTFAGVISGTGSLTKAGSGIQTLSGINTYTGNTRITAGRVKLTTPGALASSAAIDVSSGAVLDVSAMTSFTLSPAQRLTGSGTVTGQVTMASGAVVAPGSPRGTLTFQGGIILQSNAVIELEADTAVDQIRISGGVFRGNTNGTTRINVLGSGSVGNFTIIDWTGSAASGVETNDFTIGTAPAGFLASLRILGTSLQLVLVPSGPQPVSTNSIASVRLAIGDLGSRYPAEYGPKVAGFLTRLSVIEANLLANVAGTDSAFQALKREALVLSNPALNFNRILFIRRTTGSGLPQNWQNVSSISDTACKDAIGVLDITNNAVSTLYSPSMSQFLGYPTLHWNADRLLFTGQLLTNSARPYTVFEMNINGTGLRQVSPAAGSDVDWFDSCYLPCGDMLMVSTATFAGVPCVTGSDYVGNLYRVYTNGTVRQLTFDQDQNWGPTILADGRVMFTRWEYSDTPHYFSRILFTMMPDGLEQFARYGSGSFFPNCIFDAKPTPGRPSQFVAVISGHHGVAREGELLLFDEAVGTTEADGVLHRFCGPNPVLPEVRDRYIDERNPWPRFVQPCPIDEKQLIVSARPDSSSEFGLYLVDQFDNITTLHTEGANGLMHPTPIKAAPVPPVIPDRVKMGSTNGIVNISDLYFGPGLRDVPRGKIKRLRIYSVHYGYRGMGGHINTGIDGPWDVHRILGTVPVYEDGSASFYAPANKPISVQPLDEEGKALQLFRSWYTVMPGESVSCGGCHERRNDGMINAVTTASRKAPDNITPWFGPERGFSFSREVQPVLDQYCVGCHGLVGGPTNAAPDLYNTNRVAPPNTGNTFPQSYVNLHRYVRRTGNEGYFRMTNPGEWHADTSDLTQILQKGHYGVALDTNAWNRLVTWIDLNVPAWGLWSEHKTIGGTPDYHDRRMQMMAGYANITTDPEAYPVPASPRPSFVAPTIPPPIIPIAAPADTLFDVHTAKARRDAVTNSSTPSELKLNLGNGLDLVLDLIPAGRFLMGSTRGYRDEVPQTLVTNTRPFYIGKLEILNSQYALFDPAHVSGYVPILGKDHCNEGWSCNTSNQPVIRVSWAEAIRYCEWLTKKFGRKCTLPTEAQWEYACRAGTTSDMWYGPATVPWTNTVQLIPGDSFYVAGPYDNLAGYEFQNDPYPTQLYSGSTPPWYLCNSSIKDAWVATTNSGIFGSNPFGLCAMHGNAAEWTRSSYAPYPYVESDGRNRAVYDKSEWLNLKKVVRGGSCVDREKRSTASFRTGMYTWQRGYNVGFRVVADVSTTNSGLPTASFSANRTNGFAPLAVSFDATWSHDEDGSIVRYEWEFGDECTASGSNVITHSYLKPGSYQATLKVTDDDCYTATATHVITVQPRVNNALAPLAQFSVSPSTGAAPCRVTFDASASSAPGGVLKAWYWDFGDGLSGGGPIAAHTYSKPGRYTVGLTVVDDNKLRSTGMKIVTVTGNSGNQAPVVEAGPALVTTAGTNTTLVGSVSDDGVPGSALNVFWSVLKGPGPVTFGDLHATNTSVVFSTNGTYVLQLTASDGELTGSDTVTITVSSTAAYHSPQEVAWSPDGSLVAAADVTARALAIIDSRSGLVARTVKLNGEPRDLVWNATNTLFVSEHDAGTVAEVDAGTGSILRRIVVGPKPSGLALAPSKGLLLVTDRGLDRLFLIDIGSGETRAEVGVTREPLFVAVTTDQQFALVANRLPRGDGRDPELGAVLSLVNLNDPREVDTVRLPSGTTSVQRPVCSPDGRWCYVPHVLSRTHLPTTQLSRGWVANSAVSIIDLGTKALHATALFDQVADGAANPWGAALSRDGSTLWVSLSGVSELGKIKMNSLHELLASNDSVRANLDYDLSTLYRSNLVQRFPLAAAGPRGIAVSPDGAQLAIASYFKGEVLLVTTNATVTGRIGLGPQPVEDTLRRGERLFHDANGCYQRWISCVTCHPDGRADGVNWDMMNDGFGNPKNTKSMTYAVRTEPAMWTGIRANSMVGVQAGFKFIEFQAHPEQDYEDIHNFLLALEPEPSPFWMNGKLTPDAVQGKALFDRPDTQCLQCHRASYYYADTNKFDVGTRHEADYTLNDISGYVPPPLFELWRTAPYLHDGSAQTMREMLTSLNFDDRHGHTSHLTDNEIDQLVAYLLQLGGEVPDVPTNTFALLVHNGTGSGRYLPGSIVTITAADGGAPFARWVGYGVSSPDLLVSTVIMPDTDLVVTATYFGRPTISHIPDQVTTASVPVGPVIFVVADAETAASNLVVTATSANESLIPSSGIFLGGSGSNRFITLTPAPGQLGSTWITVTVSDGTYVNSDQFALTVSPTRIRMEVTQVGTVLRLSWPATASMQLQTCTSLGSSANWLPITNGIAVLNGLATYDVTPSEPRRFYRLSIP